MKLVQNYNDPMFANPLMFNLEVYFSEDNCVKAMVSDIDPTGKLSMVSIAYTNAQVSPVTDKIAQDVLGILGAVNAQEWKIGRGVVRKWMFVKTRETLN